jgi:hypothetical protein
LLKNGPQDAHSAKITEEAPYEAHLFEPENCGYHLSSNKKFSPEEEADLLCGPSPTKTGQTPKKSIQKISSPLKSKSRSRISEYEESELMEQMHSIISLQKSTSQ